MLKNTDTILYEEKSLSPETELPWFIVPGKENRPLVKKIFDRFNSEVNYCNQNTFDIDIDDKLLTVQPNVKPTQFDDKLRALGTGMGGAYCFICKGVFF